jgi:hypothetical protein
MLLPVIRVSTCRASSRPLAYRCTEQAALHLQTFKSGKAVSNGRPDVVLLKYVVANDLCMCVGGERKRQGDRSSIIMGYSRHSSIYV